MKIEFMIAIQV